MNWYRELSMSQALPWDMTLGLNLAGLNFEDFNKTQNLTIFKMSGIESKITWHSENQEN